MRKSQMAQLRHRLSDGFWNDITVSSHDSRDSVDSTEQLLDPAFVKFWKRDGHSIRNRAREE